MRKAIFAGVLRDCAPHLTAVLGYLDRLSSLFDEAAYVFVENDSVDATKQMLKAWGERRPHFSLFNLDGLGRTQIRTLRLEFARNVYLEYVRSDPVLAGFDHLCVLDMDDIGAHPIDLRKFGAALEFMRATEQCAGVFPNRMGPYYDWWALRHSEICPDDVWYEILSWVQRNGASDEEAFERTFARRIRAFDRNLAPIEVDSAFGGLGIYSMNYVRRGPNPYLGSRVRVLRNQDGQVVTVRMQQCEHVHFHAGLRQLGGRLFILPGLINGATVLSDKKPYSVYRSLCF